MLHLTETELQEVKKILQQYAKDQDVLAYGSRVTGHSHDMSDLDLLIKNPIDPLKRFENLFELRDAFRNSNLPISVDVMDWAMIPQTFRDEIDRAYVVLQKAVE